MNLQRASGEIGRRARFRFWSRKRCGFESLLAHHGCSTEWAMTRYPTSMPQEREPTDDELEEKRRKLLGETTPGSPELTTEEPDTFHSKLEEIENKAREIRSKNPTLEPPDWKLSQPSSNLSANQKGDNYRGLGVGLTVAYAFVGPTILGYGIGWLIDRRNGQVNVAQTWSTLLGLVLGFVGAVILLVQGSKSEPR